MTDQAHAHAKTGRRTLVLGSMPLKAHPEEMLAAGPWCFAGREDFFPDWEERFSFAPEPLHNRAFQDHAIAEAEALAADMIPPLAKHLAGESALPPVYWETLLAPFTINAARLVVDVWHRVKALVKAEGKKHLEVTLLPDDCVFDMMSDADIVLRGALNPVCLHWLFSVLLRPVLPAGWKVHAGDNVTERAEGDLADLRTRFRNWLVRQSLRLPVPPLKGIGLLRSLRWSLALWHKSLIPDGSRTLAGHFSSVVTGARTDLPVDPLPLFLALLPRSLRTLRHPASVSPMAAPRTRLAGIHFYEDASYRQKIAVWRARGGRIVFLQHGGNYGMMRHSSAAEFVEYSQHAFITWGWQSYRSAAGPAAGNGHFLPLPSPQLDSLRDAWTGGEDKILLVGTEMPAFGYQMDSHPTPMQNLQYREDKQWFLEALGRKRRSITLYRPYFPVPGTLDDANWLLPRSPRVHLCSGPLVPQMLKCRLLVLDHHGTTLLEAMAANVPTVCYWDPSHWPVCPVFQRVLLIFAEAGIWHSSAELAAVHIDTIWPELTLWWQSAKPQAARRAFLDHFAFCSPESLDQAWIKALKRL